MSQALIYGIGPDGKTAVAAKINAGGELVVTGGSGGGGGGGTSDTTEATQLAVLAALTAESAKLPASLGAKTAANSLAADSNPELVMNPYIIAQGWATVRHDLALTSPSTGLGANRNASLYYDTLHPNASGHAAMAARFAVDVL